MKYIFNIDVEKFCGKHPQLNIKHIMVFHWFKKYYDKQTTMMYKEFDGIVYGRVKYAAVAQDLHYALRVDEQSIRRFYYLLRDVGYLHHRTFKKITDKAPTGSYAFFAPNMENVGPFMSYYRE